MSLYSQSDLEARIKALDEKLASGVRSTSVDGTTVTVDFTAISNERDRLQRQLMKVQSRRPTSARINLGGC